MTPAPTADPGPWLPSRPYPGIEVDLTLAEAPQLDPRTADHLRDASVVQAAPTGTRANRWTAFAETAARAGVATAATFTRAGVSLASAFTPRQEHP